MPSALRRLLGGSAAEFFERAYQRESMLIEHAACPVPGLFDRTALFAARGVISADAASRDAEGRQRQESIANADIGAYFARGYTICADVAGHAQVARFLASFTSSFVVAEGLAFAKAYASPRGAGFAMHADSHEVFVLQLEGDKTWQFGRAPALESPDAAFKVQEGRAVYAAPRQGPVLRDDGSALEGPKASELEEVVLRPGHVLYLPAGTWHRTEAHGESLALSISPPRVAARELALSLVGELLDSASWRRSLNAPSSIGELDARLADLSTLLSQIDRRSLVRAHAARVATHRALHAPSGDVLPASAASVTPDTPLARTSSSPMMVLRATDDEGQEAVFFYQHGEELAFPAAAHAFLEVLARSDVFIARDALGWDARLEWNTLAQMLDALLGAGVLRRSP